MVMFKTMRYNTSHLYLELAVTTLTCYIRGMEEKVPIKKYTALREIGKVLVNFGSLTFASLVLGTIIKGEYNQLALLLIGGGISMLFITIGIISLTVAGGEK